VKEYCCIELEHTKNRYPDVFEERESGIFIFIETEEYPDGTDASGNEIIDYLDIYVGPLKFCPFCGKEQKTWEI